MPHRSFRDEMGRQWDVWDVVPTAVERRIAKAPPRAPAIERRKIQETRVVVPDRLQKGWLAFQSDRERRRLAPIPGEWDDMTATELLELLNQADRRFHADRRFARRQVVDET
jgi:hypothetical protein